MKKLFSLILLGLLCSVGNAWGETYDNPARITYAEKIFLDVAGTDANVTGTDDYLCYGTLYMLNTVEGDKFFERLAGSGGTSSSSYTYSTPATGFLAANSTSATNTYGSVNANSDRPWALYFTGAKSVSVLKKDNNTSSNKWVILKLYSVASNGTETLIETSEEDSPATSIKVLNCTTALSESTYYKLEITSGNTSNCAIYQVSLKKAPTSYTVTYNANGGSGDEMTNSTGTNITLKANTYTAPEGYSFAGWNTATDGSGTAYTAGQENVNENLTLYATWTQTVTLNANTANHGSGENSSATATLNATSLGDDFSATAAASGYRLVGYYSAATSGVKVLNADGTYADDDVTDYITDGKWTKSGATVLYAQMEEIVYYTVILNPNGGTISDATGWTLDNGQYKKTGVESGTELIIPTFTKTDREFMTWRDGSDNEHTSPITITSDLEVTAIWGKEKETEIYYWEGASGGATQRGGTATHYDSSGAVGGNTRVNYKNTANSVDYYTISLNGKTDYSTDHIRIALTNNIKTGDLIKVTAYCNKSSEAKASAKMDTQTGTAIFADDTDLPNIYSSGSPVLRTYTVPSDINTGAIKLTRNQTETGTFITKLQIIRTTIVEEQDPCQTPTITAQPADADYEWDDDISALTVTASVTDGGTLSYQWYKKGSPDAEVGTNSSSYTPSVAGTYYVVVTNSKDGYDDASATSDDAVITITDKPTYEVTFNPNNGGDETVVEVTYGEKVSSIDSPVKSGYIFAGWQKAGVDYDFNTAVTSAFTLTASWTAIDENHFVYDYSDAFHYDGIVYKTPEGKVDNGDGTSNKEMTTTYTLFAGTQGITSVIATKGIYDSKTGDIQYVTSLMKLNNSEDSYLTVNIASGYVATMTITCSGYSASRTLSFSNAVPNSATTTGKAVNGTSSSMGTITFHLGAGSHDLKVTGGTLYISNIDIQTSQSVTATIGSTGWATFSSCAPLDFTDKTVKAYKVTGVDGSDVVEVTQVNKVPANTGLLISGTTDDIPVATGDMDDMAGNLMVAGNGTSVAASDTKYVLAYQGTPDPVLGFYKIGEAVAVPYGKAYLDISSLGSAPSVIRIVDEENNATNIEALGATENAVKFIQDGKLYILRNGVVYDAMGHAIR